MSLDERNPIRDDMEALRRTTQRDLPTQEKTARTVHTRLERASREGPVMKLVRSLRARPLITSAVAVGVVAVALLAIPISYERTVGYEAKLILTSVDPAQAQGIASDFAKLLKTTEVNFMQDAASGTTITARVPVRPRRVIEGLAMAYAQALEARGMGARSSVAPVTERISGSVYAAAANEIVEIHVNRQGKTNEQIAEEIREQLAAAGLPGADVQVMQNGDQMQMRMEWQAPPGDSLACQKQINVSIDGQGQEARQNQARIQIHASKTMTDAQLKEEIERQLREQGKEGDVVVENGKVKSIQIRK